MEISYYNDATRNSLVVRCADPKETAGYQYRMISCNRIPGLLPCSIREIDGEAYLAYDVTGLQSLQRLYGERDLERESFKKLLYGIAEAGKTLSRYLLDFSGLVLAPELIFYDYAQDRYLFLYNPGEKREESLSGLLQYAEKKIRPGQKDLQFLLYRLLDLSGNPNFILKQEVLDRVLVSPAAGGGQEEEPGRDPVSFSRRGQEQCPNQDREQPYGYRWQQEETQPEVFAQEQRKEVSPPPSPEKKIKKETRSRTAGRGNCRDCAVPPPGISRCGGGHRSLRHRAELSERGKGREGDSWAGAADCASRSCRNTCRSGSPLLWDFRLAGSPGRGKLGVRFGHAGGAGRFPGSRHRDSAGLLRHRRSFDVLCFPLLSSLHSGERSRHGGLCPAGSLSRADPRPHQPGQRRRDSPHRLQQPLWHVSERGAADAK